MIYAMHATNLWHAINHWCIRGSIRSLGCPDSLQLVATWCKMVLMIGDSDVDIFNSRSHAPLIIQSLTHPLMYCWECLHVTCSIYHRHFRIIMTGGLQRYPIQLSDVRWRWLWWWWDGCNAGDGCDNVGDGCENAGDSCDNAEDVDRRAIIRWLLLPLTCS